MTSSVNIFFLIETLYIILCDLILGYVVLYHIVLLIFGHNDFLNWSLFEYDITSHFLSQRKKSLD